MNFKNIIQKILNESNYKGFSDGDEVIALKNIRCQYYDYPKPGDNNYILKKGERGIIWSVTPKVRVSEKGTGNMFFNLYKPGETTNPKIPKRLYPVMSYKDIKKIKKLNESGGNPKQIANTIII